MSRPWRMTQLPVLGLLLVAALVARSGVCRSAAAGPGLLPPHGALLWGYRGAVQDRLQNSVRDGAQGVSVLSSSYYQDGGFLYLVGEVRNGTTSNVTGVVIRATYFDAADDVLGSSSAYSEHEILVPGQVSPFVIVDLLPVGLARYELTVEAWPTTETPVGPLPVLSLLERRATPAGLSYVGEVQNTLSITVRHPKVMVTLYDGNGTVMNVQSDYALRDVLAPGDRSPFQIWVVSGPTAYASRAIRVDVSRSDQPLPELRAVNVGHTIDGSGALHFSGQVHNRGATEAALVKVVVTLYDTAGDVINCGWSFAEPSTIPAGALALFDVTIREGYEGWSSYALYPPHDAVATQTPTPTATPAHRHIYLPVLRRSM